MPATGPTVARTTPTRLIRIPDRRYRLIDANAPVSLLKPDVSLSEAAAWSLSIAVSVTRKPTTKRMIPTETMMSLDFSLLEVSGLLEGEPCIAV